MTTPKLRHSYTGESGEFMAREVCIDTENTKELNNRFPIRKILLRKYALPNTLETIEHEDLAARMLSYAKEARKIVAVNYHDFVADMHNELNENFVVEKRVFREEHSLTTQIKSALRQIVFGRSSLHPPAREEVEPVVSVLIAMARVNPGAIQGEVTNMITAGYFSNIEVNQTWYLEPTEKLLEKVFKAQTK